MRIRTWIAGAGIVALASFGVAGPAFGQEEPDISHAAEECIHLLEEGGNEPDDCHEAPSPLAPEPNEIIWGSLAFVVLLVAMWKWGIPAVRTMMATREERIRTDLEKAESSRVEAEGLIEQYRAQIADARTEASRIIEEARQSAEDVRRDLIARAEADAEQVRERAQQDVQLASERAMTELRQKVAELSIELAEKIVERNLDRNTQMQLIDNYINQVGAR